MDSLEYTTKIKKYPVNNEEKIARARSAEPGAGLAVVKKGGKKRND